MNLMNKSQHKCERRKYDFLYSIDLTMTTDQRFGQFNHLFKFHDDNFIHLYLCNVKILEIVSMQTHKTDTYGDREINKEL